MISATNTVEWLSVTDVPGTLDRGLNCATDTAQINAMRKVRVLIANYCGSLEEETKC